MWLVLKGPPRNLDALKRLSVPLERHKTTKYEYEHPEHHVYQLKVSRRAALANCRTSFSCVAQSDAKVKGADAIARLATPLERHKTQKYKDSVSCIPTVLS